MSNLIASFFQNLSDPQKRKEIVRTAFGTGEDETGSTPPARGLRGFANSLSGEAFKLGEQAGLEVAPLPEYTSSIIKTESGGNWAARNNEKGAGGRGHFGRSQFSRARFAEAKAAGVVPANMTIEEFGSDTPEGRAAQQRAEAWHYKDLETQLADLEGRVVNGKPLSKSALVAMGHLGGATGARKFVESGGRYNPNDSFGTSLADYALVHGGTTTSGNTLSYGQELDAIDPMTDEYIGRSAEAPLSMGVAVDDFETLREKYGERQAMEFLNASQTESPDALSAAIMRMLNEDEEEELNPAEEQAAVLANGGIDFYGAGGYSMGYETPASGDAGTAGTGGAATGTPPVAAPATKGDEEAAADPRVTMVDKLLNKIYGTKVEDMSDEERVDRRRAIGMALTEGFQMLSRGTPMDIQGIVKQSTEMQTARRASQELRDNAQGVSDMLIAAGMPELAQLPYAGENGMNAAMQALVSNATRAGGGAAEFDLPPTIRATVAQTMADMGHAGLAEQIMTMPPGKALEDLYGAVLGVTTSPPKGGVGYTPEQREQIAAQFEAAGNPIAAQFVRSGADDAAIGDMIKAQSAVAPAIQEAGGVAQVKAAVDSEVQAKSAEDIARAYDEAGMQREAAIARAAENGEAAEKAIEQYRADKAAAAEEASIRERGEAVAALVPDDIENSEELKQAARTARTSQDLDQVYSEIAGRTSEEQLYKLSEKDPAFLPFVTELMRARAGTEKKLPIATQMNLNEINKIAENYKDTMSGRRIAMQNNLMIRQMVSNPDFTPGKLQGNVLIPAQQWLDSLMGDAAPSLASDADMTGARLAELARAATFVAASQGLKGAISDRETGYFVATSPSIGDTKTQMLAVTQYHLRIAEIQEAEYAAVRDWVKEAEEKGKLGDREDMLRYVHEKVGHMKVFDQIQADDMDAWFDNPAREVGEVVEIFRPDGSSYYASFTR